MVRELNVLKRINSRRFFFWNSRAWTVNMRLKINYKFQDVTKKQKKKKKRTQLLFSRIETRVERVEKWIARDARDEFFNRPVKVQFAAGTRTAITVINRMRTLLVGTLQREAAWILFKTRLSPGARFARKRENPRFEVSWISKAGCECFAFRFHPVLLLVALLSAVFKSPPSSTLAALASRRAKVGLSMINATSRNEH